MEKIKIGDPVKVVTGSKPIGQVRKISKNFIYIQLVDEKGYSKGHLTIKKEHVKFDNKGEVMITLL